MTKLEYTPLLNLQGWLCDANIRFSNTFPYLRNSCRQVSQNLCPHVETWTGSLIALLHRGHWKRLLGFSRNL